MRCEIKIRGAKGLGSPGATWGVSISQLMYSVTIEAMILNEEAMSNVSLCTEGIWRGAYMVLRPNEQS